MDGSLLMFGLGITCLMRLWLNRALQGWRYFHRIPKYVDQLKAVEEQAKAGGMGIWSKEGYVTENGYNPESMKKREKDENCKNQIKGNKNSMIYHLPTGDHYNEVSDHHIIWFCSEEKAQEVGFRAAKR